MRYLLCRTSPVILYCGVLNCILEIFTVNFLKLKEIEKFESEIRQLEKNPKELLDAWREYIHHELKLNDPGMLNQRKNIIGGSN